MSLQNSSYILWSKEITRRNVFSSGVIEMNPKRFCKTSSYYSSSCFFIMSETPLNLRIIEPEASWRLQIYCQITSWILLNLHETYSHSTE